MKIRFVRIACWILKTTNKHTKFVQYSLLYRCNNGWKNAPQCYFICKLLALLRRNSLTIWHKEYDILTLRYS